MALTYFSCLFLTSPLSFQSFVISLLLTLLIPVVIYFALLLTLFAFNLICLLAFDIAVSLAHLSVTLLWQGP